MIYKKIIYSRNLRIKILSWVSWIPDASMLQIQYWLQTGRKLDLKNPKRFTEKLQLYKLRYRNPDMLRCTDKYEVRKYIEEKGYGKYLIPFIGIYDKVENLNFNILPRQFVAKSTDGGGGNQVLVCRDKDSLTVTAFRERLKGWMDAPKSKSSGREWAYENNNPRRVIIEELIGGEQIQDLIDYKFYCFNGTPHYCQVIQNRSTKESIDFFDMDWNHMPFYGLNPLYGPAAKPAAKPQNWDNMVEIAKQLSKEFPFVRVDLYNIEGRIYFGELTFYPASGYGKFTPDEWDEKLGDLFDISSFMPQ